jgi:hypothetical protein
MTPTICTNVIFEFNQIGAKHKDNPGEIKLEIKQKLDFNLPKMNLKE